MPQEGREGGGATDPTEDPQLLPGATDRRPVKRAPLGESSSGTAAYASNATATCATFRMMNARRGICIARQITVIQSGSGNAMMQSRERKTPPLALLQLPV